MLVVVELMEKQRVPDYELKNIYRAYLVRYPKKYHEDAVKATLNQAMGKHKWVNNGEPPSNEQIEIYQNTIDGFRDE